MSLREKHPPSKTYEKKLQELKTKFQLLLERLKKSYPQYKQNKTAETESIYESDMNQLEHIFSEIFLLKSELVKKNTELRNILERKDNVLKETKQMYKKEKGDMIEEDGVYNASFPREKEYMNKLHDNYIIIGFYTTGIISSIALLYKLLRA